MSYRFTIRRLPPEEHPRDLPESALRPKVITSTGFWRWFPKRFPGYGQVLDLKLQARNITPARGEYVWLLGTGNVLVDEGMDIRNQTTIRGFRVVHDRALPPGRVILARVEFEEEFTAGPS